MARRGQAPAPNRRASQRDRQGGREGGGTVKLRRPRSNWMVIRAIRRRQSRVRRLSVASRRGFCRALGDRQVVRTFAWDQAARPLLAQGRKAQRPPPPQ